MGLRSPVILTAMLTSAAISVTAVHISAADRLDRAGLPMSNLYSVRLLTPTRSAAWPSVMR